MKQSLKRAGALVLSLILLLGSANPGIILPVKAAESADSLDPAVAQAYAAVLQDIVNWYGICNAAAGSNGFVFPDGYWDEYVPDSYFGLAYADLIDFDNNGRPELYLYYVKRSDDEYVTDCVIYEELWYWDGSAAAKAHEQEIYSFTRSKSGIQEYYLYRAGEKTYLAELSNYYNKGYNHRSQDIRLFNGRQMENYQSIDESWETFEYVYGYHLKINDKVLYDGENITLGDEDEDDYHLTPESEAFYQKYTLKGQPELIYVEEYMYPHWKTNNASALLSRLQDRSISDVTGADALDRIAYIGDPGKCRMDARMANAYADALDSILASAPNEVWRGMLVDVSGDGFPLMIVADAWSWAYGYSNDFDTPQVWEYKNGRAVEHDFYQDLPGVQDAYDFEVYNSSDGLLFSAIYSGGGAPPEFGGGQFYHVSKGKLTLLHTIRGYDMDWWHPASNTHNNWNVNGTSFNGDPYEKFDLTHQYSLFSAGSFSYSTPQELSSAALLSSALRAYAGGASRYSSFPTVTEDDDRYVRDVAQAIADTLGGEITGIYKLADGVYYVIAVIDGAEQGALIRGVKENGKITWKVVQKDASPLPSEDLEHLVAGLLSRTNMSLDYSKIPGFSSFRNILDYLQDRLDNMDGVFPNDAAKTDLAAFIETSIAGLCSGSVSGKDNRLSVDASTPGDLVSQARSAWREIESLLGKNGAALNKDVVIVIRILWQDMDWSEPCQLTLDSSLADAINGCTVQLLLADGRHYVQLSADRLKTLLGRYGSLGVQLSKTGEDTYTINFLDSEDKIIGQLPAAVTIGLPAGSMTSTIMASYSGGSDNWGGQYDSSANIISFDVRYSGQYEVLENNLQIDDIGGLPEEAQAAIRFLASKGFLALDGSSFNPSGSLTRYQFTQALVGMFFALDRELATGFEDVPAGSGFYPYVASAEARGIVAGYDDVTFGGGDSMTVEQMLALAARTLIDQKGYAAPTDVEQYLSSFEDWADIDGWALQQVALAVRENLVDRGGALTPQADITRAQAAVILYRLFLLLYEVPPVALDMPPVTETEDAAPGSSPAVIAAAAGGVAALGCGAGAAWYFLTKKKKMTVK